jgi:glycosyltransferase involved in cell wall biosynthesis
MGLETLLEAWAEVCRDHPGALLGIVGEGSIRTELEEQARRLPTPSSVRLLGRLGDSDLAEWYRAADVSVVPSTALEGFGLVVLESLACGTPVVVSDAGGLPEAVNGLGPGLVEPAGDALAWSRRLSRILAGHGGLPDGDRCRAYAEEFAWKHVVAAHRHVYAPAPNHAKRLRVVYVDHCSQLAGAELALAELLANLGEVVDVHVLLGADGPLVDRLLRSGISVEVLAMAESARSLSRGRARLAGLPAAAATAGAAYTARLARRLRRLRPDLVHTNSLKAAYYGGLAGRVAGIPVVWHLHDQVVTEHLPSTSVRLTRWLARHLPSGVVANSASTLATLGPIDRPAAVVPPVIVDPDARPVPDGRHHHGFRVGMVGRLAHWKGQHVFLSAFARAFPGGDAQAIVVGGALFDDGDYETDLEELAHRLDLDGRVEFRGQVDDVSSVLAELDVMVHASVAPEPFGRVIVEAMAAGVPVIASRGGGVSELIDHEVDGLLVPPGDIDALARAMVGLERSCDLRGRLAEAGLVKARRFTAQPVVDQVVDLYDRVLGVSGGVS